MIRLDKSAAARLGFGGATADRHTTDRLYKKTQTKVRELEGRKEKRKAAAPQAAKSEELPLRHAGGCRYVVDLGADGV